MRSPHAVCLIETLTRDHERLHGLLDATLQRGFDDGAFTRFRAGLLRHIALEEKLLLPAARRARDGVPVPGARELKIEHAALTSLLVPTPDAALAGEIGALLERHDAREEGEDGVYAACERLLSPLECGELAARAASYPQVPTMPHFDGPGTHRTAAAALAAASRMRVTRPAVRR